jgi:release factor glutamine methyltransferase
VTDEVWTVLRMMRWSGEYLEEKGVDRGRLDAEHLLAHALETERLQLYLQYDRPLTRAELDRYRPLLRRRARREPLQYILGHAAFRELELAVDPRVLIPRPETEVLVQEVLDWAEGRVGEELDAVDIGTGSGAIALSLALEGPFRRVLATDASADALEVARANAEEAELADRVELRMGSLFDPLAQDERFDVVVSNPPYVAESEADDLEPEVVEWEPTGALFAGPDGLAVLRALVDGARAHLRPGGLLALEIGAGQAGPVVTAVEACGGWHDVRVRKDLAGRDRVLLARTPGSAPAGVGKPEFERQSLKTRNEADG